MKLTFETRILMSFEGTVIGDNVVTDTSNLSISLLPDPNVIAEDYVNDADYITEEGAEIVTDMLVESLMAIMSYSDKKGYLKDHVYLKEVISRLEAGLLEPEEVSERKNIRE